MNPEHVYVITTAGNEQKLMHAVSELVRVGLIENDHDPRLTVMYGTNPAMYRFVLEKCEKVEPYIREYKYALGCTMTHYLTLQEAFERKFASVAVFEDNVSFLSDTDAAKAAIECRPDAELTLLSWTPALQPGRWYSHSGEHEKHLSRFPGERWVMSHPYATYSDASGYIVTAKGIRGLLRVMDTAWYPDSQIPNASELKTIDLWWDAVILRATGVSVAISVPPVSVQSWVKPDGTDDACRKNEFYQTCCKEFDPNAYNVNWVKTDEQAQQAV